MATVRSQRPTVTQIVLQPVVGGPDNGLCQQRGSTVRASENHPVIDEAIRIVAGANSDVVVGYSPEVPSCDGYRDQLGHLTDAARGSVGAAIAAAYG